MVSKKEESEVNSEKPRVDFHAIFERRLHRRLKIAVKELGYGTLAAWVRSAAISTIQEWEEMKAQAEK